MKNFTLAVDSITLLATTPLIPVTILIAWLALRRSGELLKTTRD